MPTDVHIMSPLEFQFVFGGFVTAWLIVVIYAVSLGLRERRLRKELDRVREMVEKRNASLALMEKAG